VVNQQFAEVYYPKQNPVGKRFWIGDRKGQALEIVGVAKNTKYVSLAEPPFTAIYQPLQQNAQNRMTLMLESYATPRRC